jgi:23S rRNA (pseudouridine1915-N3)-methyltransferase
VGDGRDGHASTRSTSDIVRFGRASRVLSAGRVCPVLRPPRLPRIPGAVKLVVVAVGQRAPAWAQQAYEDYAKRFPPELRLELKAVKPEPRGSKPAEALMAAERTRIEAALPRGARTVALDERGERVTTQELATRLRVWMREGRDVAFLIGGPDGLDAQLKAAADERLRLSDLTLPHAFVRVMLAEALYRASSVVAGHPYHRE